MLYTMHYEQLSFYTYQYFFFRKYYQKKYYLFRESSQPGHGLSIFYSK